MIEKVLDGESIQMEHLNLKSDEMRKVKIKESVLTHVNDVLSYDNHLCNSVRKNVTKKAKEFYAVLPEGVKNESIYDFSNGGVIPVQRKYIDKNFQCEKLGDASDWLAAYLYKKIKKYHYTCVFDDVMAVQEDVNSFEHTSVTVNSEIYHMVCGRNIEDIEDIEMIKKLIFAVKVSWHFVCVLIKEERISRDKKNSISMSEFDEYLNSPCEVIVGAYDGESFVISKIN